MNYAGVYAGPLPPQFLLNLLDIVGGRNAFDQPNFRAIHAGFRMEPAGGTWVAWDPSLKPHERTQRPKATKILGADGRPHKVVQTPWRTIVEVRLAMKYPEVGHSADGEPRWWVLEKWHGPDTYGSPERWHLPSTSGGTMVWVEGAMKYMPSQGDFPYEGAYEHTNFEFPQSALTEAVVITAVQRQLRAVEDPRRPGTAYGRMLRRVYEAQEAEKKMAAARRAADMDLINECDTAFGNNPTSFGGGTKRRRSVNDFVERAGIKIHSGVS